MKINITIEVSNCYHGTHEMIAKCLKHYNELDNLANEVNVDIKATEEHRIEFLEDGRYILM